TVRASSYPLRMFVLVDAPLPDSSAEAIHRLSPRIVLEHTPGDGKRLAPDLVARADVIYTTSADFDPADAPRLRWVQTNSAATQPVRGKAVMATSIPVCNVSGAYSVAVAECAMGMLLAVTRKITQ